MGQNDSLPPIQTDRPTQAVAASTIPAKALQIESGFVYQKLAGQPETDQLAWNILWRLGVLKGLELRLVTQPEWRSIARREKNNRQISGLADLQAGAKINLWQRPGSFS
ncbi:MAG: hypothetical protein U5L96_02195 [Owenweeksia sp.]|nr:hypothetical protein [Owenweeksia sp.]